MGEATHLADIYALGATAYTLLTGFVPPESIGRMSGEELPAPRSLNPTITSPVEEAILRAMQLKPDQRFARATEFRTALKSPEIPSTAFKPPAPTIVAPPPTFKKPSSAETAALESRPHAVIPGSAKIGKKRAVWPWLVIFGLLVLSAGGLFAVWQRPDIFSLGLFQFIRPPQEQPVEPSPDFPSDTEPVGAPVPPPSELEPTRPPVEEPAEPDPPAATQPIPEQPGEPLPKFGPMAGEWNGVVREISGERRNYKLKLFIEHPPFSERFGGSMEVRFPDGHVETRDIVEGVFSGNEFRLKDNTDLHYWGIFEGDHLAGQAAWGCYDCAPWAEFEFFR